MQCPACEFPSAADARFCARCGRAFPGRAFPDRSPSGDESTTPTGAKADERRQLTVVFCDLVDSTALAERLDPEDLRDLVGAYHTACAGIVEKYEGYVAQYLGDGLLAYFSYPQAHEDDPERAVRAGLEIVAAVDRIEPPRNAQLLVRVAIHTGAVVVGALGKRQAVALGHPLNLAARLESIATAHSVVMSGQTEQLVRGLFETEDLGLFELKGIHEPVHVHRVLGASCAASRLEHTAATGLTPLTGREADLALLDERLRHTQEGNGQVVLLSGEPGIGKSRLVRALRERLADEPHRWLECHSSPHHQSSAFHPLLELLRERLQLADAGSAAERVAAIEAAVERAAIPREAVVPLLAKLLSLPLPERYSDPGLAPDAQRRRTLEALAAWLVALAKQQPVVVVIEDLHWADPSTLELLEALIEPAASVSVLLLATTRPSYEPYWEPHAHLTRHVVAPLSRAESATLVGRVAGGASLARHTVDEVVRKADGVPLFVEELTRSVLESGASEPFEIPATLKDLLAERLDRLGPSKVVAQIGAVLGREFSCDEIAAVATVDAWSLARGLQQLAAAGLLLRREDGAKVSYNFKHGLIQEAAEQSLLRGARREWHARVARVFEARFPARAAAEPETMARHCDAGGLTEKAVAYRLRAAEVAGERSATLETIDHLSRGLELVQNLPAGRERSHRELELQAALGAAWAATKGWGSREAEQAYERAARLSEELGEAPTLFPAIRGVLTFSVSRARLDDALDLSTRLLRLAERGGDASQHLVAHHQAGVVHCFRGDQSVALAHFREALARYEPAQHRRLAPIFQADPGVLVRSWMAWSLWLSGQPDEALRRCEEALAAAREERHPFGVAHSHAALALVHLWRRERRAARERAEQGIAIAREHEFGAIEAGCTLTHSLSRIHPQADEAEIESALAELCQAAATLGSLGSDGSARPVALGLLAEALASVGRQAEARAAVEGALAFSRDTSARFYDAELHRIRAATLAEDGPGQHEAGRALQQALAIARKQEARMLELRAAVALLRRSKSAEDHAALGAIVARFTEGHGIPDLVEARALLADAGATGAAA